VVRLTAIAVTAGSDAGLLPSHRFTTGDEVEIRAKTDKQSPSGVVSEVTDTSISIALFPSRNHNQRMEEGDDEVLGPPPLSLLPKSSVEVHRKIGRALNDLETNGTNHPVSGAVIRALFEAPSPDHNDNGIAAPVIRPLNDQLDDSQLAAVAFCHTNHRPVALIHGPPGTGKTTTVVELIQQAVHTFHKKVLVAAPSNVAVDNVLAKLVASSEGAPPAASRRRRDQNSKPKLRVVRLGHPARLQANILPYSLEALVQASDATEIVADVRQELQNFLRIASNSKARYSDKRVAYREIKALRKEVRVREEKVVASLLQHAHVVLTTCVGAANKLLNDVDFDLVVIDEAAQALEAACWIPALRGRKLVLAGDHWQLPPTIKSSRRVVQQGLGKTMFARAMELYGDDDSQRELGRVSRMLRVQYRMHKLIADWASQALYGGALQTATNVQSRTLAQLTGCLDEEEDCFGAASNAALLLIDTTGCNMHESVNAAGSRFNEGEAQIVRQHVQTLLDMGVRQEQIAIISPYNGQVELLRSALLPDAPHLEIRSVDGFQGGEREAVVLSLVRSSARGGVDGIGFLGDNRRLNVAVTRAKRHCCVVCDSETVSKSPFIRGLVDWIEEHGETRAALEFVEGADEGQITEDLAHAEAELLKIVAKETEAIPLKSTSKSEAAKDEAGIELARFRSELLGKVKAFAQNAKPGGEMRLSNGLSKGDRKALHELAEHSGLVHKSEGVEGVDRHMTIGIPWTMSTKETEVYDRSSSSPWIAGADETDGNNGSSNHREPALDVDVDESVSGTFSVLTLPESSDEEDGEDGIDSEEVTPKTPAMNSLLGNLAKERAARHRQQTNIAPPRSLPAASIPRSKQAKKKNGKVLGGAVKSSTKSSDDRNLDDLDDMAFLNAQIDKVQTSHGRNIDAPGSGYRSIVNGILIAKPKAHEKQRDTKASAALQSKLKQAQEGRKSKPKKKT
jgi:ATP-dependent RNA/DNA helicase IGHMBP2